MAVRIRATLTSCTNQKKKRNSFLLKQEREGFLFSLITIKRGGRRGRGRKGRDSYMDGTIKQENTKTFLQKQMKRRRSFSTQFLSELKMEFPAVCVRLENQVKHINSTCVCVCVCVCQKRSCHLEGLFLH